jgi:hypothetical protein
VPRATYRGGFDIQQGPGYVLILYNFSHYYRHIPTDGRSGRPGNTARFWMGSSRGSWDGNTLVVDVTNLNGKNWLDQVGNFFGAGAHVIERFTLAAPGIIDYQVTIDDPQTFTRPWTIRLPIRRAGIPASDRYAPGNVGARLPRREQVGGRDARAWIPLVPRRDTSTVSCVRFCTDSLPTGLLGSDRRLP